MSDLHNHNQRRQALRDNEEWAKGILERNLTETQKKKLDELNKIKIHRRHATYKKDR